MLNLFLQNVWTVSTVVVVALIAIYVWCCARKIFSLNREIKKVLETSDLADALKDSELLAPAWKNFEKSLTKIGDEIFSTTDAAEFFSPQNLTRGMNMTFWQSYGGIFTGLGILGTFAGLTFGLSGVDMTSGDIEVLKSGIAKLLSGVESAFVTSLVGIFFAIIYSVIHHCLMKNFHGNVQKLADKLDENFPRLSAESLLEKSYVEAQSQTAELKNIGGQAANGNSLLEKSYVEAQSQTTELKNIDTIIGDQKAILQNIGEQVTEAIHNALDERLAEYVENICAAIDNLGKGGSAAIGEIFSERVGEQMARFSAALDRFSDSIDEKLKAADEISKIMNEQLLNTLKDLDETLKRQAKDSADARDAEHQKFSDALSNLIKTFVATLIVDLKDFTQQQKNILNVSANSNAAQIFEAVKAFREIVDNHNKTTQKTFTQIQNLLSETENFLQLMEDASTSLKQAAEPVKQSTLLLTRNLTATSEQMKTTYRRGLGISSRTLTALQMNSNVRRKLFATAWTTTTSRRTQA